MKKKLFLLFSLLALCTLFCCCANKKATPNKTAKESTTNNSSVAVKNSTPATTAVDNTATGNNSTTNNTTDNNSSNTNNNSSTTNAADPAVKVSSAALPASICKVFPDPELSKIVAKLLNKDVNDVVTKEELASYKGKLDCLPGELSDLSGIGYLTGITYLNCCKNNVKVIPSEIKNLVNLESLDFGKAYGVQSIPPEIGCLQKLKYIRFCLTPISSIPKEIGNLKNLQILNLGANEIQSVPEEIGNLKKLQLLDLHSNKLTSIPESICDLTDLRYVDLSHNTLTSLPTNFGNLTKIKNLNLFNNKIKFLPKNMKAMVYLDSMNVLDNMELSENYKDFMPKLTSFTLKAQQDSNCDIELPVSFNNSNMKCEFKNEDVNYEVYYNYNEITPQCPEGKKITLDKSLFSKKGAYEFRIIQKNSDSTPIYNVYAWHITVE